jgi:hypothetical protein
MASRPAKERAVRAITGRLIPQLPARGRFHCCDFGEADRMQILSASDRTIR